MTTYELSDYSTLDEVELSREQIRDLAAVAPSIRVAPSSQAGAWRLSTGAHVGIVVLGDTTLKIGPRFGLSRVMFLLAYAMGLADWTVQPTPLDEADNPLEIIAPSFLAALDRALSPGPLHGYRVSDESLTVIRGRVRFGDQLRQRYGLSAPVEVTYDEFTDDIVENRLLRSALRRIRHVPIRPPGIRRALHRHDRALSTVTPVDFRPNAIPTITWTRLNERYRNAVALADLILRNTSIEHRRGNVTSTSFLVNMNDLFEDFVVAALRQQLGLDERTFAQGARGKALHLDAARRVALEPDVSWWEGDRCVFVGDCKYKSVKVAGVKHPDLYQLLAYTTATGLDSGLLIYAKGEAESRDHIVPLAEKHLRVTALDLSGTPDQILEEIGRLASLISSMRSAHRGSTAALAHVP